MSAMHYASIIQQKRFSNETKLLDKEPLNYITAYQDKSNTLTWYFLVTPKNRKIEH